MARLNDNKAVVKAEDEFSLQCGENQAGRITKRLGAVQSLFYIEMGKLNE